VVEVSTNNLGTDEILIKAGSKSVSPQLEKEVKDHFRAKLRVAPELELMDPKTILSMQFPDNVRKPIIFIDHRKQN
jgi:phenylacetate-CoA ligase